MISITNLSKQYGSKTVLRAVNLTFKKGEVHGIVGNNGAGKSTLFRCIAGLEDYEGSIHAELEPIKNHLGFLSTDPFFFSKITGQEYLQLLCHARNLSISDFAEKNIFDLPLGDYAINYSTGMKKKLAITGTLLQQNDYFIFDEPFNGLDLQSNIIVTAIIQHLKSLNKLVLISSHIFSTLNDSCDQIHLLRDGSIVKSSYAEDFKEIEEEMKQLTLGDRIHKLGIR